MGGIMADFNQAFNFTVQNEGGYSNHSMDRGGATKYGITEGTLMAWRRKEVTIEDVQNLELEEAKLIYKTLYFDALRLEECANDITAILIFDQCVNRGPVTVAREVQFLLGVKIDGIVGSKTLAALNSADQLEFQVEFVKICQLSYIEIARKIPEQMVFLRGWINRTHELLSLVVYSGQRLSLL